MSAYYTAVVAHGKNWELPVPDDPADIRLSIESELTARAAGMLYVAGLADTIIFSTGATAGGAYPTEASAMRREMRTRFTTEQVPDDAILMEEDSYDTPTNVRAVRELCAAHGIGNVMLLTVGYHLPRTKYLARKAGLPVIAAYSSDDVVYRYGQEPTHVYARSVIGQSLDRRTVKPLVRTAASYVLEAAGWGIALIDPTGEGVTKSITTRLRHRQGE